MTHVIRRFRVVDKQARQVKKTREPGHHEGNMEGFEPQIPRS
jgi:hypothetical protein